MSYKELCNMKNYCETLLSAMKCFDYRSDEWQLLWKTYKVRSYCIWYYEEKGNRSRSYFYHTTNKDEFDKKIAFCEYNNFEYYFETESYLV